jgi:murein L,D-transpeptidase YcbB/YkuD
MRFSVKHSKWMSGSAERRKPEVQIEEQRLDVLPDTITVRTFSVNIYSYPAQ